MSSASETQAVVNPRDWQLCQIMLRVKDYKKSLWFYQELLGMSLIHEKHFEEAKFSLYFLASLTQDEFKNWPDTKSDASNVAMKQYKGCVLELTYNHGTENDPDFKYHSGNEDPQGFGHVAFLTDDVYASCDKLKEAGISFKKLPDDGKMKGLAFAYDPDGYWVEILKRENSQLQSTKRTGFTLHHGMIRVKDPKISVPFYSKHFGMTLICKRDFPDMKFTLYFLSHEQPSKHTTLPAPESEEAWQYCLSIPTTCIELTHNHGTESDDSFTVNNGNVEPYRGFGHFGFFCNDVYKTCEALESDGVAFQKRPLEGRMKGLAFAKDPDGYWLEILKHGSADKFD